MFVLVILSPLLFLLYVSLFFSLPLKTYTSLIKNSVLLATPFVFFYCLVQRVLFSTFMLSTGGQQIFFVTVSYVLLPLVLGICLFICTRSYYLFENKGREYAHLIIVALFFVVGISELLINCISVILLEPFILNHDLLYIPVSKIFLHTSLQVFLYATIVNTASKFMHTALVSCIVLTYVFGVWHFISNNTGLAILLIGIQVVLSYGYLTIMLYSSGKYHREIVTVNVYDISS